MNNNLTLEDAQKFTQLFRRTLPAGNYDKFCKFLDGFLKVEIDFQEFVMKTMDLIEGDETLIKEFIKFLPIPSRQSDSCITSTVTAAAGEKPPAVRRRKKTTDKSKSVLENYCLQRKASRPNKFGTSKKRPWELADDREKMSACVDFLQQVKDKVEDSDSFMDFLEMMIDYEMHKDIDRLNKEVCELFKNQPDLLYEFSSFVAEAFDERDRKKEKEKGIAMANKTLSHELQLSEFTLKWMEMGKETLRARSEENPVKKKQKSATMAETAEESDHNSEEKMLPSAKNPMSLAVADEEKVLEEYLALHLSETPMKIKEESDEISSEEMNQPMFDEFEKMSSDGEELYSEEMVELSLAVPASNCFLSTDLVLSAPACRVEAC